MLYQRVKILNQDIIAILAKKVWAALTLWDVAGRAAADPEADFPPRRAQRSHGKTRLTLFQA
jgi:hypothetical protein